MLLNNIKIALRQVKKQKFYSLINIFGLAIGVACCILIALFVKDELSYDKQHPNVDNLYRVALDINMNDWVGKGAAVPPILGPALVAEIPEIESMARLNPFFDNAKSNLVRKEKEKDNRFEEGFVYVDQSFFELFNLPLIYGDKNNILTKPKTVVISERMAQKYFSDQNPIGEILVLNDSPEESFTITGVMENIPTQSHFHYDFFMSINTLEETSSTNWIWNNYFAYVTLKDGTDPKTLDAKLHEFALKNFGPQFKEQMNTDLAAIEKNGQYYKLHLQPVTDIHLHSEGVTPQLESNGDIRYVKLFGAIALFLLLIALVNFVNLSTARSANRAKEVGLRKVLGSVKKQLVSQFLVESILMSFLAFLLGTLATIFLLPAFNDLSGKTLNIPFTDSQFVLVVLGSAVLTGTLAGLYPAFYLSAFQPIKVLKGKLSMGSKNSWLRSGLVVVQFAISIGLIVGTLVVYQQMEFIQNKSLGFEKDQVLLIQDTYTISDKLPAFKEALKKLPEVKNATVTSFLPLDGGRRNSVAFYPEGKTKTQNQVLLQCWNVDEDYINTLSMNLKQGRDFNKEMATERLNIILNETAVRSFGLTGDPIGKKITTPFTDDLFTVIGVLEDFHFESLKGKVGDVALFLKESNSVVSIKSSAAEMDKLIAKTEAVWKSFAPTQPFRYDFLDDRFAKMYTTEDRVSKLFLIFSLLAIFIACMGLLALTTFMTEQRKKEIGIRKVLGASVPDIVFSISKVFLIYVFIGLLIAVPLAWAQMSNWLDNFAYRIEIEWWFFLLSGLLAIGIAFLTVGVQSLKAALINPVESIRGE